MKQRFILCLSGLILFTMSCKKSVDTPAPIYYSIPSEMQDYLKLRVGSYFIYQDSATGETDSVVVTKSSIQKIAYPAQSYTYSFWGSRNSGISPAYSADSLVLELTKETPGGSVSWLSIKYQQRAGNICDVYDVNQTNGMWINNYAFWYPITTRYIPSENQGGYMIPSIAIENNTYQNVARIIYSNGQVFPSSSPYYIKTDYYWAKGVGVIKKTNISKNEVHTWTLIRNN